jgi:predicted MFS family arabinose efflux permease
MTSPEKTILSPPPLTLSFLMIGNIIIGAGVLAPAAMINSMSVDLGVSVTAVGALIGWGAVILCVGAPLFGFISNRMGRRTLLALSLLVYAFGHALSAVATDYVTLLIVRLVMIGAAAVYTPQAAGTVALFVPEGRRAGAVAYVFMGWSVAAAVVVPLMSLAADALSWRSVFGALALLAGASAAGVAWLTPAKLHTARMSLKMWGEVVTRPAILLLLATTAIQMAGQFTLYPYLAVELKTVSGADGSGVALALGLYGGAGLVSSLISTRIVGRIGAPRTQLSSLAFIALGLTVWSFFATHYGPAALACALWGLGFGAVVSMQQARLIAVSPPHASASVALNTSVLYLGQALGVAAGSALVEIGASAWLGPAGLAFIILALLASFTAWRRLGV